VGKKLARHKLWLRRKRNCAGDAGVMLVDVGLELEEVYVLLLELFGNLWVHFFYGVHHVFAHVFVAILLEDFARELLAFILYSVNKVAEVASGAALRAMVVLARDCPVVSHLDLLLGLFLRELCVLLLLLLSFDVVFDELCNLCLKGCNCLLMLQSKRNQVDSLKVCSVLIGLHNDCLDSLAHSWLLVYIKGVSISLKVVS